MLLSIPSWLLVPWSAQRPGSSPLDGIHVTSVAQIGRSGNGWALPTNTRIVRLERRQNYLGGRGARRFAGTLLRLLVTGFFVFAASNNCRMPSSNSSTAFSKAPSCPTRTIATDRRRSKEGGRKTFTGLNERFLAIKRAG